MQSNPGGLEAAPSPVRRAFALVVLLSLPARAGAPSDVPIREQKPWVLGLGVGWNSLEGAGIIASHHLLPHLSIDAGLGLSLVGPKLGVRARYNLLQTPLTPFAAAGLIYAAGWAPGIVVIQGSDTYARGLKATLFGQLVVGGEWVSRFGLAARVDLGYALRFVDNVRSQHPSRSEETAVGSGLVFSLDLGWAFN